MPAMQAVCVYIHACIFSCLYACACMCVHIYVCMVCMCSYRFKYATNECILMLTK